MSPITGIDLFVFVRVVPANASLGKEIRNMFTTVTRQCIGALFFASLMFANASEATVITVGPTNSGNDCTFPCMVRLQQAYDSSVFPGQVTINEISFFSTATHQMNATYSLFVGYIDSYNGLTSDLDDNASGGTTLFDSLVLTGSSFAGDVTRFTGAFNYNPAKGDLLIDIIRSAETGVNTGRFAASSGLPVARAYQWPSNSTFAQVGYGISTQFEVVPTPGSLAIIGIGLLAVGFTRRKVNHAY